MITCVPSLKMIILKIQRSYSVSQCVGSVYLILLSSSDFQGHNTCSKFKVKIFSFIIENIYAFLYIYDYILDKYRNY